MTNPQNQPEDPYSKNDNFGYYLKQNSKETIIYILLVLGIVLLFYNPLYGGVLVGIVTGAYYGDDIVIYISNWQATLASHGLARHLITAGIAIAFLISAPAIFLGAALVIGIRHLFIGQHPRK